MSLGGPDDAPKPPVAAPPIARAVVDTATLAPQLDQLVRFHKIVGWLILLCSIGPGFYIVLGYLILTNDEFAREMAGPGSSPDKGPFMGLFFTVVGGAFMALAWVVAGFTLYAAKLIKERRKWAWVFATAIANIIHFPFGTALGIYSLVVLMKPEAKAAFDSEPQTA